MAGVHSPVGASGAGKRVQCPGSVTLEQQYPETEEDREESRQGDAAHWGLSRILTGSMPEVNDQAPNGVYLDDEMVDAIDLGYDLVSALLKPYGKAPSDGISEGVVEGSAIHPMAFGTPDYRIWLTPRHLFILDFKYGHGFVEVYQNAQLIDYTAYLLPKDVLDLEIRVTVAIFQPRAFHRDGPFRTWTFQASEIRGHINVSRASCEEALGPNPRTRVGPECRYCRARAACDTFRQAVHLDLDWSESALTTDLPSDALALQLRKVDVALKRLKAYQVGLQEVAMAHVRAGRHLPGWLLERTSGREKWTVGVDQLRALGTLMGKPLIRDNPVTPAQARKLGIPEATVDAMCHRPGGGLALVPDTGSTARRVFGRVGT